MFNIKKYTPKLEEVSTLLDSEETGLYCLYIQNQELAIRIYDTLIGSGYIEKSLVFIDWNKPSINKRHKVFTVAPTLKKFKVRAFTSKDSATKLNHLYFPLYEDSFFKNWDFKFVMVEKSRYICK